MHSQNSPVSLRCVSTAQFVCSGCSSLAALPTHLALEGEGRARRCEHASAPGSHNLRDKTGDGEGEGAAQEETAAHASWRAPGNARPEGFALTSCLLVKPVMPAGSTRKKRQRNGPVLSAHYKMRNRVPLVDFDVNPFCVERQLDDQQVQIDRNKVCFGIDLSPCLCSETLSQALGRSAALPEPTAL